MLPFRQVDVFGAVALGGNPVAVVHDDDGLTADQMQAIARWTNLSETTFLRRPTVPDADYRVRIFTPAEEMPFAGHPTLGSAHAWLEAGGRPAVPDRVVQECGVGLVTVRRGERLGFAGPPLIRSGPVEADLRRAVLDAVGLGDDEVQDVAWVDNGPGWVGVLVGDADRLRRLTPSFPAGSRLDVGLVALTDDDPEVACEVRAFFPGVGHTAEDPVTGSLNASLAEWLIGEGRLVAPYRARQGTAVGARGVVFVDRDDDGTIWVSGATRTVVAGHLETDVLR